MQNRISTVLWLVLLILTGVSFLLGEASHPGPVAVALIGLITFTKGKLVFYIYGNVAYGTFAIFNLVP